jgi:hypothetical protein
MIRNGVTVAEWISCGNGKNRATSKKIMLIFDETLLGRKKQRNFQFFE